MIGALKTAMSTPVAGDIAYALVLAFVIMELVKAAWVYAIHRRLSDGTYTSNHALPTHLRNTGDVLEARRLIGAGHVCNASSGKPINLTGFRLLGVLSILCVACAAVIWAVQFLG